MLQEVCEHIHNYFIKDARKGTYEIADGLISLDFVKEGQRILIVGSDLNDGVYTYHATGLTDDDDVENANLTDEDFFGSVCALAVPPAVIALSVEIKKWMDKYGEVVNSPYSSEDVIGVYSYTKGNRSNRSGDSEAVVWQSVFKDRLDRWRKVAF